MKEATTRKSQTTKQLTGEAQAVNGYSSIIELEDYLNLEQEKLASFLRVLEIFGKAKHAAEKSQLF